MENNSTVNLTLNRELMNSTKNLTEYEGQEQFFSLAMAHIMYKIGKF